MNIIFVKNNNCTFTQNSRHLQCKYIHILNFNIYFISSFFLLFYCNKIKFICKLKSLFIWVFYITLYCKIFLLLSYMDLFCPNFSQNYFFVLKFNTFQQILAQFFSKNLFFPLNINMAWLFFFGKCRYWLFQSLYVFKDRNWLIYRFYARLKNKVE